METFTFWRLEIRTRHLWLLSSLCLSGCASTPQPIEHRAVPCYTVSDVVVPASLSSVRAALLEGLTADGERRDPAYRTLGFVSRDSSGSETLAPAMAEEQSHALFGAAFFRDSTHVDDLYVHFMGVAIVSSYYCAKGRALDYGASFSIRLAPIGESKTKMTIRTVESQAFVGSELNLHAMGFVPSAVAVSESPIDQYRMLTYAAHLVGVPLTQIKEDLVSGCR
jgi:hypothetical protein